MIGMYKYLIFINKSIVNVAFILVSLYSIDDIIYRRNIPNFNVSVFFKQTTCGNNDYHSHSHIKGKYQNKEHIGVATWLARVGTHLQQIRHNKLGALWEALSSQSCFQFSATW